MVSTKQNKNKNCGIKNFGSKLQKSVELWIVVWSGIWIVPPWPWGLGNHPSIKKLWIFHVKFLTIFNAWTYLTRFIASVSDSKVFALAPWLTVWPTSGASEAWKEIQISNRINLLNRKKTEWKITEKQKKFYNFNKK